jgi:hypothetical protein
LFDCRGTPRPYRRTDHHVAAARTGNGTANQQQVTLDIDAHDLQRLLGPRHRAHVARHPFAGEYATGILSHTD